MRAQISAAAKWLLGPEIPAPGRPGHLWPRWIFLRALGLIYFSAFYSLVFQIKGLLGPTGILPAEDFLKAVAASLHSERFWFAPSILWLGSSDRALMILCLVGMIASLLIVLNVWPRANLAICFVCFVSFVSVAQDFSGYQSDGMLLEAGFVSLFFAPPGIWPGLAAEHPASRASLYLLRWEWFRIYFESGVSKWTSGDLSWHNFTAMDQYYQNGPLPTWIGWYAQHLPHWFQASTVALTLAVELFLVWMLFLPRPFRIVCFFIVTPFEIGIILTANYAFLNYIVLSLGFLLLDDQFIESILPLRLRKLTSQFLSREEIPSGHPPPETVSPLAVSSGHDLSAEQAGFSRAANAAERERGEQSLVGPGFSHDVNRSEGGTALAAEARVPDGQAISSSRSHLPNWRHALAPIAMAVSGLCFALVFYVTTAKLLEELSPGIPLPQSPITLIEPLRIAQDYHLFGTMTPNRLEIEFQGTLDGVHWIPYEFRYKPQALNKPPGIYAPYQPRFEWNLWFASLDSWQQNRFVFSTEERLLKNDPDVLELFAGNPFSNQPPIRVRTLLYQYWFTDMQTKRRTGLWWRRQLLGEYAPELTREPNGAIEIFSVPSIPSAPSSGDSP